MLHKKPTESAVIGDSFDVVEGEVTASHLVDLPSTLKDYFEICGE